MVVRPWTLTLTLSAAETRQHTLSVSLEANAAPLLSAAAEIEQVSSLFQEKQAELQSAVLRVEQLSLQLEDLRRGKLNGVQSNLGAQVTGAAALELRKLYQELQVRAAAGMTHVYTQKHKLT